jgi:hypothetical protein
MTMDLEHRVAKLERENRRLRVAGLLALMLVGTLFVMGQARPARVLEAESFILRDPTGIVLGRFAVDEDGYPRLSLNDRAGVIRTDFHVSESGVYVFFRESTGETRMEMVLNDGDSGPAILLRQSAAKHFGIVLQAPNTIDPFIQVRDQANQTVWSTR